MLSSSPPSKIPVPFANSGTKNTIPTASQISVTPGAASLTDGFPPLTFTPLAAGGVAPFGADFNGILNRVTAIQQWQTSGGLFAYDAAQSTAIGGYPKGAILVKADASGTWQSLVDNNTSNPDTGGSGWIDGSSGRLINTRVITSSGPYTPTPGTASVIVELCGGGGGSAGCATTDGSTGAIAGGGGAGAYGKSRFTSGFSGVTVTIGAAGAAGASGANSGGNGGATSFGALLSADGGTGSAPFSGPAGTSSIGAGGGPGGATVTGSNILQLPGASGDYGIILGGSIAGGEGGSSPFGGVGGKGGGTGSVGTAGAAPGAGGGGGANQASSSAHGGSAGAAGIVIVYEYS